MKLIDSLRQECMPEMVYSICRFVQSREYKKQEVQDFITLWDEGKSVFSVVFLFSEECGFIEQNPQGIYSTKFSSEDLSNFRMFRYRINKEVFKGIKNKFTDVAAYYINAPLSLVSVSNSEEIAQEISKEDKFNNQKITGDFILGFRFWMTALGYLIKQGNRKSSSYVFALHYSIQDWLELDQPFKKGEILSFRKFIEQLSDTLPLFAECMSGKTINESLSVALMVLQNTGRIKLIHTPDSFDVWLLSLPKLYINSSRVTEIKVEI